MNLKNYLFFLSNIFIFIFLFIYIKKEKKKYDNIEIEKVDYNKKGWSCGL